MIPRWRQTLATWLVMASAAMALPNLVVTGPWVRTTQWLLVAVIGSIGLVQWATHRLGWFWQALLSGLVGEAVLTCGMVGWLTPHLTRFGFLPRWSGLLTTDGYLGWALRHLGPEVPPTPNMATFAPLAAIAVGHIAVLAGLAAIVMGWIPALGLAGAAPWVVACALRIDSDWGWALITLGAFLIALAFGAPVPGFRRTATGGDPSGWGVPRRGQAPVPALLVVGLAVAAGLGTTLVPPTLPGWGAGTAWVLSHPWNAGPGNGLSAGIAVDGAFDINSQLTNSSNVVLLRATGSYTGPLKLYSIYDFDGETWQPPDPNEGRRPVATGSLLWPDGEVQPAYTQTADVVVAQVNWQYDYVPLALGPRALTSDADILYGDSSDSARFAGWPKDLAISQTALMNDPVLQEQTDGARQSSPRVSYQPLRLPHAEQIGALARQLGAQAHAATPDQYLRAFVAYLQGSHFTYTLKPDLSHSTGDPVWDFLQRGTGYCVHYATALVALGRAVGIPMRGAVGFVGGRAEDGWRTFTSAQAHMWAEAHLQGLGWVAYDATPASITQAPSISPSPTPTPSPSPTTPTTRPTPTAPSTPSATPGPGATTGPGLFVPVWLRWALAGLLAAAALGSAIGWAVHRRNGRLETAWGDIVRRATRLGFVGPAATPRTVAAAVRERLDNDPARQGLRDLARAVERTRYGPPDAASPSLAPADVRRARALILAGLRRSPHLG